MAGPHYFTVTRFRKPCAAPEEVRVCSSDAVTIAYAKQACQGQVANCWPHSDTAILQAAITAFFFSSLHCTILHYEKDNSSELFWFFLLELVFAFKSPYELFKRKHTNTQKIMLLKVILPFQLEKTLA